MSSLHQPLAILHFADERPGHYSLAEGIIAALARRRPVTVHRVEVRRPRWIPARVLSSLVNAHVAPEIILKRVYGLDAAALPAADVIVSAGGDTLAANVAAARRLGVPNIFYGSLRRYREQDFALVMTSYARHAGRPRHLVTPKPNKLDPDTLAGAPDRPRPVPGTPPGTFGLLVGGNAGTVTFAEQDWETLLQLVAAVHAATGARWIVSTSPRTPPAAADAFGAMARDGAGPVKRFVDFRSAGPGTLGPVLADSDVVAVTSDSSSMLSEAIWVRRPVVALAPADAALPADEAEYRRFLEASGWCRTLPLRALTAARFLDALGSIRPMAENPLDVLAGKIADRLPQLFV